MRHSRSFLLLASLILAPFANAGGYDDVDFSLRLPAALSRFAGYADVAAVGNSSAGSKWSTSVNPASSAFLPIATPLHLSLTPQFSTILFDEGTNLYVATESALWQSKSLGTFLPAAAQVRSNTDSTAQGPDFSFDADIFQLQWALRPTDNLALGLNLSYSSSTTEFSMYDMSLAKTDSDGVTLRAGALYQFSPKIRAGLVADYGVTLNDNTVMPIYAPNNSLGYPGSFSYKSTTEQVSIRPGISYEYAADSTVYVDYQMLLLSDTDTGHADFHRFSAGVDHQLVKGVFVRAGALVDTTGHFSWTCGAAVSPAKWISIDLAYQHDFFPELANELGQSQTLTLSLSFSL